MTMEFGLVNCFRGYLYNEELGYRSDRLFGSRAFTVVTLGCAGVLYTLVRSFFRPVAAGCVAQCRLSVPGALCI